jgi:hypothetical protein
VAPVPKKATALRSLKRVTARDEDFEFSSSDDDDATFQKVVSNERLMKSNAKTSSTEPIILQSDDAELPLW